MNTLKEAGRIVELQRLNLIGLLGHSIAARRHDERGEGVISMSIAVLIVAFLGVALWIAFRDFAVETGTTLDEQVDQIGG